MADPGGQQVTVGDLGPVRMEGGEEDRPLGVLDRDGDTGGLAGHAGRRGHGEAIGQVHVHEGRDVKGLVHGLAYRAGGLLDRHHIGMATAEGVGHLVQDGAQPAVHGVAEEDAERIEAVAEDTGHGQQLDRAATRDAGLGQAGRDLGLQRRVGAVAEIGGAQGHQAEATGTEPAQTLHQPVPLVEVEQQHEDTVLQGMDARTGPPVEHRPGIEARACARRGHSAANAMAGAGDGVVSGMRPLSFSTVQGRRTPPMASATARPA